MTMGSGKVGHYEEMGQLNELNIMAGDENKRNPTLEQMNKLGDGTDIDLESKADFDAEKGVDSKRGMTQINDNEDTQAAL